jgi:hypothetical protein
VISCDPGCPQRGGSTESLIHDRMAPVIFLAVISGAAMLGTRFRSLPAWRSLSVYSLVSSALGLAFLAALVSSLETRALSGLWQRLMLATLFLWCAVVGLRASREPSAAKD